MKNVILFDVQEWDALVKSIYGKPYDFQQQDGCKSRGVAYLIVPDDSRDHKNITIPEIVNGPEMGVSFTAWLARDPQMPLAKQDYDWQRELWWERNFYPNVQMVANDLCEKGLLAPGEYAINIDW